MHNVLIIMVSLTGILYFAVAYFLPLYAAWLLRLMDTVYKARMHPSIPILLFLFLSIRNEHWISSRLLLTYIKNSP